MRAALEAVCGRRAKDRKVPRRGNDNAAVERMVRTVIRRRKRSLREQDVTVTDPPKVRRAVTAAALGNTMEWFDFGVYAYLAGTLGKVFFPSSSPGARVVSTFATFAAAFLVRPLGGLVFWSPCSPPSSAPTG